MELDYKAIGKRIKIARIKKNLTQEAIADKIGITPQHVSNIETGNASVKSNNPSSDCKHINCFCK